MASRRSLFAGSAIMLLEAPAALAAAGPSQILSEPTPPSRDTHLLWMIARYNDLERDRCRALDDSPEGIAEERAYEQRVVAPIEERQNALFARIRETPATTTHGVLARIGMLAVSAPWRVKDTCGDDGMIAAIIRDGLAIQAAGTGSA